MPRARPPVSVSVHLRGSIEPSRKDIREAENAQALGGMRDPARSVRRVPEAQAVGARLRPLLQAHMRAHPHIQRCVLGILRGGDPPHSPPGGMDPSALHSLRSRVLQALGHRHTPAQPSGGRHEPVPSNISASVIQAYCRASGDPDEVLADWLRLGAPLGVVHPLDTRGVFPPISEPTPATPQEIASLVVSPDGWENYRSADDDPAVCAELLGAMISKG